MGTEVYTGKPTLRHMYEDLETWAIECPVCKEHSAIASHKYGPYKCASGCVFQLIVDGWYVQSEVPEDEEKE